MKKLIAIILSLVTALSLCACGAKEPVDEPKNPSQSAQEGEQTQPKDSQPEATQPEQPQIPNLDMFVGKWNIVEENFLTEVATFEIKADGTLEANGETLTWTAEKAHPDSKYEMILKVEYPADPSFPNSVPTRAFDLRLTRTPENTYVAEKRLTQMSTTGDQFYREGDYEVVELNDQNAMEYLQEEQAYYTFDVKNDKEYKVVRNEEIKFKDGLGALSYCSGGLVMETTYVEIRLTGDAKDFTEGAVTSTNVNEDGVWSNIRINEPRQYTYTLYWFGEVGSADLQKPGSMECNHLIGTKDISGYVFIPVKG